MIVEDMPNPETQDVLKEFSQVQSPEVQQIKVRPNMHMKFKMKTPLLEDRELREHIRNHPNS